MDTIVYARATTGSMPLGYKEIDQEFKYFFQQTNNWLDDQNYFDNTAPVLATVPKWNFNFTLGKIIGTETTYFGTVRMSPVPPECDGITTICAHVYGDVDLFQPEGEGLSYSYTVDDYRIFVEDTIDNPDLPNGYFLFVINVASGFSLTETVDVKDYSGFNQDALDVAASPLANYLSDGVSNPSVLADIWQTISELFGVVHGVDHEASIINNIRILAQVIFGAGVPQDLPNENELNRVELLFTDIGWPGLPPLARHAYVMITTPSGDRYVTRGGPDPFPSYGVFGALFAESDLNPEFEADFPDIERTILFRQLVTYMADLPTPFDALLSSYHNATSTATIDYKLVNQNSNSYVFQVVEKLVGTRPRSIPYAPGWTRILPAP
tara:strand:- start:826 stop:1968 length:1143 start_codon:yes stop_codon:yes gene_type:complete